MNDATPYSAKLDITRIHIADVATRCGTERLSWIRTAGLSVNIVISERKVGNKLAPPRLIGRFTVDEGEDEIKALCRDYVRRQNEPSLNPLPLPPMVPGDMRPDEEIEFGLEPEPLFGAPR